MAKFFENRRERSALNAALTPKLVERTAARAKHPELQESVVGFVIKVQPSERGVEAFFKGLMKKIGEMTESVRPDGNLTPRFVLAASQDMQHDPWMNFMCFNRGLEAVEIEIAQIQAKLLALQHGVKILSMESYGQEMEAAARAHDQQVELERRKGRKIIGKFSIPEMSQSYVVEIIVSGRFREFSARAVVCIAREAVFREIYQNIVIGSETDRSRQRAKIEAILADPTAIEQLLAEQREHLSAAEATPDGVRAVLREQLANMGRAEQGVKVELPGFSPEQALVRPRDVERLAAREPSIRVISEQNLQPDEFISCNPDGRDYIIKSRVLSV